MKKSILLSTIACLAAFIAQDVIASSEGKGISFLEEYREKILNEPNPHKYDGQMGELTSVAQKVFNKCFNSPKLQSFEDASRDLAQVAEKEMGEAGAPDFGGTWSNLLAERLKGDQHHALLPMVLYFNPSLDEKKLLLFSIVPQNPSMSAVDNVWFTILVEHLKKNNCQ